MQGQPVSVGDVNWKTETSWPWKIAPEDDNPVPEWRAVNMRSIPRFTQSHWLHFFVCRRKYNGWRDMENARKWMQLLRYTRTHILFFVKSMYGSSHVIQFLLIFMLIVSSMRTTRLHFIFSTGVKLKNTTTKIPIKHFRVKNLSKPSRLQNPIGFYIMIRFNKI